MSLIKETTAHVLAGQSVIINGVSQEPKFQGYEHLNGAKVISGALLPRTQGDYLVLDNKTGDPLELPSNIGMFQVFFIPTIPLESANLGTASLTFKCFDDINFSNSFTPSFDNPTVSAEAANARAFIQIDDGEVLSGYIGFPYCGVTVDNEDITAGVLQVYIYYFEAYTPILP